MKHQCDFCKSEDVETLFLDGEIVVMCQVCGVESIIAYPESIDYLAMREQEEYPSESWEC